MDNFKPKKESIKSITYRWLISLGKILVALILIFFTYGLFFVKSEGQIIFGICLLVFVTLPTIFVVYFKTGFLQRHENFSKPWKVLRIIYAVIIILFATTVILGLFRMHDRHKTQKAIDFINSQKITLNDVMGKNLPPAPDQKLNDSTIAGIDANKNGIRDDVELAIFKEYPNSAKIRAAELQYAQALQLELTQVFNSATLVATIRKEDSAYNCIGGSGQDSSLSAVNGKEKELDDIILNTYLRKNKQADNLKGYMTSYSLPKNNDCEIDFSSLPN